MLSNTKLYSLLGQRRCLPSIQKLMLSGQLDPQQEKLLEEKCILVDENDRRIGFNTKRNCHLLNSEKLPPLHRAFSVFLFNGKAELVLQQRSDMKITFPGQFTNTCCSHPLAIETELEETDAKGVKRAAQRRLQCELGIPSTSTNIEDFEYLTRIHYGSCSDRVWGEHEVDYILFLRSDEAINPDANEVKNIEFIQRRDLNKFLNSLEEKNVKITPWFKMISKKFLPLWWENLDDLRKFYDHETIHKLS